MRIWGYLLVVLNVAATGAFVYFATSLWKARSDWQYAAFKVEMVNRGLPVAAPKNPDPDIDEDFVPFEFQYGEFRNEQIAKKKLQALIPPGGKILGAKPGQLITNQIDEVKRVQQIVFADLDAVGRAEKRLRLMILLLNLARDNGREGVYALLRDLPVEQRRSVGRKELRFLGRSAPQTSALQAVAALGEALIGFEPNQSPDETATRSRDARRALAVWALSEVPYITPDPLPPAIPPSGDDADKPPDNADRDRLRDALKVVLADMEAAVPDQAKLTSNREALMALLEGDTALLSSQAAKLLPFVADIGTNALDSREKAEAAKARLLELMLLRTGTQAEKDSLTGIVNLMAPAANDDPMKAEEARDSAIDAVGMAMLRIYFEEALAPLSTEDLPDDVATARTRLLGLNPVRDADEQRRKIAHLLYHLDAHVGIPKESRDTWYRTFIVPEALTAAQSAVPEYKMLPADEAFLENRILWHQRVAAVVGLQMYAPVVEDQASKLNRIARDIATRISGEQTLFKTEYQNVVLEIQALSDRLDIRQEELKDQQDNLRKAKAKLETELSHLKEQEDFLAASTAKARTALTSLENKVDELFQITQTLGNAQDALVGLEIKLRELELPKAETKK